MGQAEQKRDYEDKQNYEELIQRMDHSDEKFEEFKKLLKKTNNRSIIRNVAEVIIALDLIALLIAAVHYGTSLLNQFETIQENLKVVATKEDYIRLDNGITALTNRVEVLETDGKYQMVLLDQDSISQVAVVGNNRELHMCSLEWTAETAIGKNNQYLAKELEDEQMLATYKSDGLDCVFWGRYNDKYHWDGNCLVNAYNESGELAYIMEAVYDDGKLLRYKNISADFSSHEEPIWIVSERIITTDINIGETWNYYRDENILCDFEMSKVNPNCLKYVSEFKDMMRGKEEAYYCGNTSDGYYNDETGNAYLVKFDRDGTVKTFYMGKFKNGMYNDDTGKAWLIARNPETNTGYMYTRGIFLDNVCSEDMGMVEEFKHDLTQEQIGEYMKGYAIKCDLEWFSQEQI